jgi:hemerythrin-like domain-containing protein
VLAKIILPSPAEMTLLQTCEGPKRSTRGRDWGRGRGHGSHDDPLILQSFSAPERMGRSVRGTDTPPDREVEVSYMTATQEQDVVTMLVEQHHQVRNLFGELNTATGDRKRELFEDLVRLLAVHETAEEEVVHPIARRKIDGGEQVVETRLQEEDQAKRALGELYDLGVDNPEFDNKLVPFEQAVEQHATREESEEFARLRARLSAEELQRMGGAVRAAQAMAPTRPHPDSPESAAGNLLVGPPLAIFDRVRDAVRDWMKEHKSG